MSDRRIPLLVGLSSGLMVAVALTPVFPFLFYAAGASVLPQNSELVWTGRVLDATFSEPARVFGPGYVRTVLGAGLLIAVCQHIRIWRRNRIDGYRSPRKQNAYGLLSLAIGFCVGFPAAVVGFGLLAAFAAIPDAPAGHVWVRTGTRYSGATGLIGFLVLMVLLGVAHSLIQRKVVRPLERRAGAELDGFGALGFVAGVIAALACIAVFAWQIASL